MMTKDDETVNRFSIAIAELMREGLDPEFAEDSASLVFVAGPPLDGAKIDEWTINTKECQHDIIYLTFVPGRERFGPTSVAVFAERWGAVFRWTDCELWAPKDGGPVLAMPQGLNVCFSHDGKALISHPTRPAKSLRNGVLRARQLLLRAARAVTDEQVSKVEMEWKRAA
jgi:hypothetical protein